MRADHDINSTFGEVGNDFLILSTASEAAHHIDNDRILSHALAKGVEVLLAEHGSRHQQRDLLAGQHRF